jgi:hypothetical protein
MENPQHSLSNLFAQLGLPSEASDIALFIAAHSPLPLGVPLIEAPFWTSSQASFLCEEILKDADWAEVIDELNEALRA